MKTATIIMAIAILALAGCKAQPPSPTPLKCAELRQRVGQWTADMPPSPEKENLLGYFDSAARSQGCRW